MTDAQFTGMLIATIGTLLTIASAIVAIVIKPVINLNKTITKLDTTLNNQSKEYDVLKNRVDKHGEQIDDCEKRLTIVEVRTEKKYH